MFMEILTQRRLAVAVEVERVAGSKAACRSALKQEPEPQIAPDERLAPCMAAPTISV